MVENKKQPHSCNCGNEPNEDELYAQLSSILNMKRDMPGSLIPILQTTQNLFGYLPERALRIIATATGKPYSEVAGVVGFYSFFSTTPKGKHTVRVCMGTACYVRGGQEVLKALMDKLDVSVGDTTPDRHFSLEVGRCFGACGLAPVVMVDDDTYQSVKPSKVSDILNNYK